MMFTVDQDPCAYYSCNFGALCVVDAGRPVCQCPNDCSSYGDHLLQTAVCGSDGRNYDAECDMKKRACNDHLNLQVRYTGLCGELFSALVQLYSCTLPIPHYPRRFKF